MAFQGSVSQTLSVEVAIPIYTFTFSVIESTPVGPIWKGGTIKIDGVPYEVSPDTQPSIQLVAGRHTIQVIIPSGYRFMQWTDSGGAVVDNVNANPTGFTTSEEGAVFAYIEQIIIATAIEISLAQTPPVAPGSPLDFTGKLTRTDTGAGLAGQTFTLEQPPGTGVKSGTTDSAGNYSISVTAPTIPSTYQYRTSFAGTAGLGKSVSRTLGLGVGIPFDPKAILGSLLSAVILLGASLFKPGR